MKRDIKGITYWSILAFLLGIITLAPMFIREYHQYITHLKPNKRAFEWSDVAIYTLFISIFSLFHWCVTDLLGAAWWFAL